MHPVRFAAGLAFLSFAPSVMDVRPDVNGERNSWTGVQALRIRAQMPLPRRSGIVVSTVLLSCVFTERRVLSGQPFFGAGLQITKARVLQRYQGFFLDPKASS